MTEHDRARRWREAHGLSYDQLAALSGYSQEAIRWLEKGVTPPRRLANGDRRIDTRVWHRYRMICAGVEARLTSGKQFNWGK